MSTAVVTRNREFAVAKVTVQAAAARKPRNRKRYNRNDWKREAAR